MFDGAQRVALTARRQNRGFITSGAELLILTPFDFTTFNCFAVNYGALFIARTLPLKSEVTPLTINLLIALVPQNFVFLPEPFLLFKPHFSFAND